LIDVAGVDFGGFYRRGSILAEKSWTDIEQVPLRAWFRFKSRPKEVVQIEKIDLQYAAGFDPRSPMKAGPAVLIGGQWWRPSEMGTVFEVSLDGLNGWQECVGEIGGRGDVASRLARLEAALASNRGKISDDVAAVLKEQIATVEQQGQFLAKLSDEVDTMKEQVAALSRRDELTKEIRQIDAGLNSAAAEEKSPAGNSAPTPKANSGAKPPERR